MLCFKHFQRLVNNHIFLSDDLLGFSIGAWFCVLDQLHTLHVEFTIVSCEFYELVGLLWELLVLDFDIEGPLGLGGVGGVGAGCFLRLFEGEFAFQLLELPLKVVVFVLEGIRPLSEGFEIFLKAEDVVD
jgi:hypothetical protein